MLWFLLKSFNTGTQQVTDRLNQGKIGNKRTQSERKPSNSFHASNKVVSISKHLWCSAGAPEQQTRTILLITLPRFGCEALLTPVRVRVCLCNPTSLCLLHQSRAHRPWGCWKGREKATLWQHVHTAQTGVQGCKCSITRQSIKKKEAANIYNAIGKPRIVPALPLPRAEAGILLHAASACLAASDRPYQAVPTSVGNTTS